MKIHTYRAPIPVCFLALLCLIATLSASGAEPGAAYRVTTGMKIQGALEIVQDALNRSSEYTYTQVLHVLGTTNKDATFARIKGLAEVETLAQLKQFDRYGYALSLDSIGVVDSTMLIAYVSTLVETPLRAIPSNCQVVLELEQNRVKVTEIASLLDSLEMCASVVDSLAKASPERWATALGKYDPTTFDIHADNMLRPAQLHSSESYTRLNNVSSQDMFDTRIFGGPYAVSAVRLWDQTYSEFSFDRLIITDINWDRVIGSGRQNSADFIKAVGSHGTSSTQFACPRGVCTQFGRYLVADTYNNRISMYALDYDGELTFHNFVTDGLDQPWDIASASILDTSTGYYDRKIAVADWGSSRILIYDYQRRFGTDSLTRDRITCLPGTGDFQVDHPTSLCFARDRVTHGDTRWLYVADAGNNRVVFFSSRYPATNDKYWGETPAGTFPDDAYLTSVSVDNWGYVWVVDSHNSMIYRFAPALHSLIATFGGEGVADNQLMHPYRFGLAKGNVIEGLIGDSVTYEPWILRDGFVTEPFTNETGVRRYLIRNQILENHIEYHPRPDSDVMDGDYIVPCWYQADHSIATVQLTGPNFGAGTGHVANAPIRLPGTQRVPFFLDTSAGTGPYTAIISIYDWADSSFDFPEEVIMQEITINRQIISGERFRVDQPPSLHGYPYEGYNQCVFPNESVWHMLNWEIVDTEYGGCFYTVHSPYAEFSEDTLLYPGGQSTIHTLRDAVWVRVLEDPGKKIDHIPWIWIYMSEWVGQDSIIYLDTVEYTGRVWSSLCTSPCSTLCYPPSTCPMLYAWDGTEMTFLNNILPQSEFAGVNDTDRVDSYPILALKPEDDSTYRFVIREDENEISYLDRVGLRVFDVPDTESELRFNHLNEVVALTGGKLVVTSAVTNTGDDVTELLVAEDGIALEVDNQDGYVDIEFDLQRHAQNAVKGSTGGGGTMDPPKALYKDPADSVVTDEYKLYAKDATGKYELVATRYPRLSKTQQLIQLSEYFLNGKLSIRIMWNRSFSLDYFSYEPYEVLAATSAEASLLSATHSNGVPVLEALSEERDDYVTLSPGQQIELSFSVPPAEYKTRRLFMFEAKGYYASTDDDDPASKGAGNVPAEFSFAPNFPNPFNPATSFSFSLPEASHVELTVYNILGQVVAVVVDDDYEAGTHTLHWEGRLSGGESVASGIYFAKLTAGSHTATRKMMVVK